MVAPGFRIAHRHRSVGRRRRPARSGGGHPRGGLGPAGHPGRPPSAAHPPGRSARRTTPRGSRRPTDFALDGFRAAATTGRLSLVRRAAAERRRGHLPATRGPRCASGAAGRFPRLPDCLPGIPHLAVAPPLRVRTGRVTTCITRSGPVLHVPDAARCPLRVATVNRPHSGGRPVRAVRPATGLPGADRAHPRARPARPVAEAPRALGGPAPRTSPSAPARPSPSHRIRPRAGRASAPTRRCRRIPDPRRRPEKAPLCTGRHG